MPAAQPGPIPPLPAKITIPKFKGGPKPDGTIQVPSSTCFHYAGIQSIWLWYLVELDLLTSYLEPVGLTPYNFGGRKPMGAVNLCFFNATSFYGMGNPGNTGVGGFNETELNIAAFATSVGAKVPQGIPFADFLRLGEQTKRVGNYRVWVACDDPVAVAFGRQYYQENKFLSPYTYNVPGPNNPSVTTWSWTCHDDTPKQLEIYSGAVDTQGQVGLSSNMSEWIDLSWDAETQRPVGSRRNFFGLHTTYMLKDSAKAVELTYGQSRHPMRKDLLNLIGTRRAAAIQQFTSPTCIAEASPYFADL